MKKKIKKPIFFWTSVSCLLLLMTFTPAYIVPEYKSKNSIRSKLNTFSPLEKEYLTNLFKVGIFIDGFGYTIFADKPMSFFTIDMVSPSRSIQGFDYMDIRHIWTFYRLREGWEVWLKYSSLFPLEGFSIIYYPFPIDPSKFIEVAIINHKYFIQAVDEHLSDFQTVLEKKLSAREILEEYIKGSGDIFNRIRNHDGLFGTLLGFGRDNAWEYMRRSGGKTLDRFLNAGEQTDTQHILPPAFTAIGDSEETHKLRIQYEKERPKIDLIFQSEYLIEIILSKLTGQSQIDFSQ